MTATVDDPTDYEIMDKGDYLDEHFFKGDIIKPDGQKFLNQMKTFRDGVAEVLKDNPEMAGQLLKMFKTKFATEPV